MMAPHTTVTLSGVVGAGKSSAARQIVQGLRAAGCRAELIRFQDFTRQRKRREARSAEDTPGVTAASSPQEETRWVGYERRRLTLSLAIGHVFRAVLFRARLWQMPSDTVLVFDRYFYDSLVHFDLRRGGVPMRLMLGAIPPPSIAAVLLLSETTIRQRRTRYSMDYARAIVGGYEELLGQVSGLMVVQTDDFGAVSTAATRIVSRVLESRDVRSAQVTS